MTHSNTLKSRFNKDFVQHFYYKKRHRLSPPYRSQKSNYYLKKITKKPMVDSPMKHLHEYILCNMIQQFFPLTITISNHERV